MTNATIVDAEAADPSCSPLIRHFAALIRLWRRELAREIACVRKLPLRGLSILGHIESQAVWLSLLAFP
jgi:hypothetical protein